ncbi:isochorismatase family protein [Pelagerythrobacter marinus]|uniref:isochorismatase family protein n=1 Tax=Pelagerythrobacter marinus TaxID=538382 RepID=UPI002037582E|nr:isochorismatase family protein [Pelagerythrobacter marinus]USA40473.1 isochorismatase family protein [Pelagerythrobacter marinus]WPZ08357.1 isochorismatase family protein [Pelagerythrobacter marinus]
MSGAARLPAIAPYALPAADELPPSRADWRLDPARAALLVHDMQRYFLAAFGAGESPASAIEGRIAALLDAARRAGMPVFYTAQKGAQDRRDRGLQADLWGPGMKAAPEHEEIAPALAPRAEDFVLVKHRYSAFQRSNLETLMRARGRDQLVICGVYAHIGCQATALEAFQRDIQPFMVADAVADFSRAWHDTAIRTVANCSGVVLSARQVLETIG